MIKVTEEIARLLSKKAVLEAHDEENTDEYQEILNRLYEIFIDSLVF